MPVPNELDRDRQWARVAAGMLRAAFPLAEREEMLADVRKEFDERKRRDGAAAARGWLYWQVIRSLPPLLRRSWWRGWTGFEPRANRTRPGGPMWETWIMDLRFAVRRLRSRPLYAFLSVLTLALGVGGTAATFGIARRLLFAPLPFVREGEIATFWSPFDWTEEEFLYLRGRIPGFQRVAAYRGGDATLELGDAPARLIPGIAASSELFAVLGASPAIGRGFQSGDDALGADPVVVLSYGLWQDLGGEPSIVGRRLRLDGGYRTVVGVMPRGFWFPDPGVRLWLAAPLDPARRVGNYAFVGRVAPGQDVHRMDTPLAQLAALLKERFDYPQQWDKTRNPGVTPVRQALIGSLAPALRATLAAMALILLIACANVAALMLGQVEGRAAELALRSALGADRARLTWQLMSETLLLGVGAGAAGAALAAAAFRTLVGSLPLGAWSENARLDWSVFGLAMAIATLASLLVASAPIIALWRGDLRGILGKARTSGISGRGGRLESGLVVGEVALAVLIAAGAGLLVRSVSRLYAVDPGVETHGVVVVDAALPANMTPVLRRQTLHRLTAALATLPGVRSASAVQKLPLRGNGWSSSMSVEGRPDVNRTTTFVRMVLPGYFETMGIPVRSGRVFQNADEANTEPSIVINAALARKYFAAENPIGRRIDTGFGALARIIGVVDDVAEASLTDPPAPTRYMLYEQLGFVPEGNTLVLRMEAGRDGGSVLDAARRTIEREAPAVAVQQVTTMERVFAKAVGPALQVMTLLALLTTLALILGAVGVYGVISHFATRRRRDWGIRLALGLPPSSVVMRVVTRGLSLVAAGIALGTLAALSLGRFLSSFLYTVGTADPLALTAAVAVLLVIGLVATLVPAWRASRVSPASVLGEQ